MFVNIHEEKGFNGVSYRMQPLNQKFLFASWTYPGAPLLPRSLRELWSNKKLPLWLCEELEIDAESTCLALDDVVWKGPGRISKRIKHYLQLLVSRDLSGIEDVVAIKQSWLPQLQLEHIPLRVRTTRLISVLKSRILVDGLDSITFGQIAAYRNIGASSLLDFACTIEAALDSYSPQPSQISADIEGAQIQTELSRTLDEEWVFSVNGKDPRFAGVLSPGQISLSDRLMEHLTGESENNPYLFLATSHQLLASVRACRSKVNEIAKMRLDEALLDLIRASMPGSDSSRYEAIAARLGWLGAPPDSLVEAGKKAGLTRERIRQLQKKLLQRLSGKMLYMPSLDQAIETLTNAAPITVHSAATLLKELGISNDAFYPDGVICAAEILGREAKISIQKVNGELYVVSDSEDLRFKEVSSVARKLATSGGLVDIHDVFDRTSTNESTAGVVDLKRILETLPEVRFIDDSWFMWSGLGRDGLASVSRKMLSVVSPISVASLREGYRRKTKFKISSGHNDYALLVPPISVMRDYYEIHPLFVLNSLDEVSLLPNNTVELSQTEQVLVAALRVEASGFLDRIELVRRCIDRGVNKSTANVMITYSPIIKHVGPGLWSLRGVKVDPAIADSVIGTSQSRIPQESVDDYGWAPDGKLIIGFHLRDYAASQTYSIPSSLHEYLCDKSFQAFDERGQSIGVVKAYSYGSLSDVSLLLPRWEPDSEDLLIFSFDIRHQTVSVQIGGAELLENLVEGETAEFQFASLHQ